MVCGVRSIPHHDITSPIGTLYRKAMASSHESIASPGMGATRIGRVRPEVGSAQHEDLEQRISIVPPRIMPRSAQLPASVVYDAC